MGLIMLQPDLGTTLVFVGIGVGLLMVGNVPARYLVAMIILGVRRDVRHPRTRTRSTTTSVTA